ncbi:MAG: hypothetical protein AMXMBFR84_00220 [Candidatus Hydrogenedentota bacterium]
MFKTIASARLPAAALVFTGIVLGWLAHSGLSREASAQPHRVIHRDKSENIDGVAVGPKGEKIVAYSVGPLELPAGAIADVRVQMEVTNDLKGNVGVGRQIVRTNAPDAVSGIPVTPRCMDNVTPDMHHAVLVHNGLDEIVESETGQYYNVVLWAASTHVEGILELERGYGELIVEVR